MILEIICAACAGSGTVIGLITTFIELKEAHPLKDQLGAYPWLWENNAGFTCPKCGYPSKRQPPICSCEEYPREHFHWKCVDCEYKCIMRTYDDM